MTISVEDGSLAVRFHPVRWSTRAAAVAAALAFAVSCASAVAAEPAVEMFTREGCPHCTDAKQFLAGLAASRPGLTIVEHDVVREPAALARLHELVREHRLTAASVPTFVVGDQVVVGFESAGTTGAALLRAIAGERAAEPTGIVLPWIGAVDATRLGLPLFTITLGLIDGFNPCAMWVLLFVLSLLVNLHDRTRMALIGGTFVAISGLVYFAFMSAWLQVFLLVGVGRFVQVALGCVAVAVGLVNLKDFVAFGRGFSLSIPSSMKPAIYAGARRIMTAENFTGALVATVVLALLVNIVELLCTAGLPAVYTHVLAMRELPSWQYHAYIALYNVAYVVDDGMMVTIAVVTLSRRKLQERTGRFLKLASGLVMLVLGMLLLLQPGWLG
jgi:glutaredoxin